MTREGKRRSNGEENVRKARGKTDWRKGIREKMKKINTGGKNKHEERRRKERP